MYPNLYYAFRDLFGVDWSFLKIFNTFGFFVALSFIGAAWVLTIEFRRKQAQGLLTYTEQSITSGAPATAGEILLHFLLGFILGFKVIGAITIPGALDDPQSFILSTRGSLLFGLLAGAVFGWLKWREKKRQQLAKPEQRIIRIWPQDRVGDLVIYAAVFGFLGAKIFHNLENWGDFIKAPLEALVSFSGLTFYGGLICAAIAIYFYSRKHKIPFVHMCDANAPGLMLAYGMGRIGCQVSGDGDWGILNSAYVSDSQAHIVPATPAMFQQAVVSNQAFFAQEFGTPSAAHHLYARAFWGLPDWLFAYNYPHNVINEGVPLVDCPGAYCHYLPIPVFPTPLYEMTVCLILFAFLFAFRKKIKIPGRMFAIYLILNGIERFFIEKIRINTTYSIFGFHPTQAEIISSLLVVTGVALYVYAPRIRVPNFKNSLS